MIDDNECYIVNMHFIFVVQLCCFQGVTDFDKAPGLALDPGEADLPSETAFASEEILIDILGVLGLSGEPVTAEVKNVRVGRPTFSAGEVNTGTVGVVLPNAVVVGSFGANSFRDFKFELGLTSQCRSCCLTLFLTKALSNLNKYYLEHCTTSAKILVR